MCCEVENIEADEQTTRHTRKDKLGTIEIKG